MYLPGNVSLRLGRPIDWDGVARRVRDAPEADLLIQKTDRTKWLLVPFPVHEFRAATDPVSVERRLTG